MSALPRHAQWQSKPPRHAKWPPQTELDYVPLTDERRTKIVNWLIVTAEERKNQDLSIPSLEPLPDPKLLEPESDREQFYGTQEYRDALKRDTRSALLDVNTEQDLDEPITKRVRIQEPTRLRKNDGKSTPPPSQQPLKLVTAADEAEDQACDGPNAWVRGMLNDALAAEVSDMVQDQGRERIANYEAEGKASSGTPRDPRSRPAYNPKSYAARMGRMGFFSADARE